MRLLADAGRAQEAVRVYREFRTHLESDIGAEPDEATTGLYQSICHRLNRKTSLPE
jgi:DNA-binding SARP family transcriptional activator